MKVRCTYCNQLANLVRGDSLFGSDFAHVYLWACFPCKARVSCKKGTTEPLGTFAKSKLRNMRKNAHKNLDSIWKSGLATRTETYELLASELGIKKEDCHISLFDESRCEQAIEKAQEIKFKLKGVGFLP